MPGNAFSLRPESGRWRRGHAQFATVNWETPQTRRRPHRTCALHRYFDQRLPCGFAGPIGAVATEPNVAVPSAMSDTNRHARHYNHRAIWFHHFLALCSTGRKRCLCGFVRTVVEMDELTGLADRSATSVKN